MRIALLILLLALALPVEARSRRRVRRIARVTAPPVFVVFPDVVEVITWAEIQKGDL